MSDEPKKRYMLYSHQTVRPNFNCRLSPFSHAFIASLAKTREVALGRAVDFIINEYVAVRELHERLKENKKTLQFLKRCEKGDES